MPPGEHDVDRALPELLEEVRILQMGAQILLGFLLAVAYTQVVSTASDSERRLYAAAVLVTTAAVVLLLSPVPLHRLNFGQRDRPAILEVGHVLALVGTLFLALSIVLSVWLAAEFALPGAVGLLVTAAVSLVLVTWVVVPFLLRVRGRWPRDR